MILRHIDRFASWWGTMSLVVLIGVLVAVGGTWAFIEIADEVTEGDTQKFDDWALQALRKPDGTPIGPRWMHEAGRDLTALGGVMVLSLFTFGVAGYLLMVRKYHAMWLVIIATFGGLIVSTILKRSFDRDRPDIVPHLSHVYTSSFPSGHSMLSAVVYLTLGSLLARLAPNYKVKLYFIGLALFLTSLVGVSRVYMGVHYPTDVLAGWTAGCVWATLCYIVARQLQIRGKVERDVDEPGGAQAAQATQGQG